ncbi:HNHc domain-containing protein [Penicillium ucsense]|uniref:HNHc domain-containing protein n=1 Tax=Penicillium ucsense TaxID=2839758 RepID=A0A8J8VXN9_9EURO|nr:HNHc domain-containing protein [Penicillium ucsense]KAF7739040.1 HNHc domain-containing protein [Penicillium ucsense]
MDTFTIFSEFEDPERQELIDRLVNLDTGFTTVTRTGMLLMWLCDLDILRRAVEPEQKEYRRFLKLIVTVPMMDHAGIWAGNKAVVRDEPGDRIRQGSAKLRRLDLQDTACSTKATPRISAIRSPRSPARSQLPVPSQVSTSPRPLRSSSESKKLILDRDGVRCVLTQLGQPTLHIAHIIPFKLNGVTGRDDPIWTWLETFWGEERTRSWKQQLIQGEDDALNTEFLANLMTLSVQAHCYLDAGLCAFRPISINEAKTSMTVSFHWLPLPMADARRTSRVPLQSYPYPERRQGWVHTPRENEEDGEIGLFHWGRMEVIRSGFIFEMSTPDPKIMPLPSFELLELRWHLSRIMAMQGAAEDEDDDFLSDYETTQVPSRSVVPPVRAEPENRDDGWDFSRGRDFSWLQPPAQIVAHPDENVLPSRPMPIRPRIRRSPTSHKGSPTKENPRPIGARSLSPEKTQPSEGALMEAQDWAWVRGRGGG